MKKIVFLVITFVLIGMSAEKLHAQGMAIATAETSGNVIVPLTIDKIQDLQFGNIVPTAVAGTVIIAPIGDRSVTGGVLIFSNATGNPHQAQFVVHGEPNATYSIDVPAEAFMVTSGENEMQVSTFTTAPTPTGTLNGEGSQTLDVGATLNVNLNQAPGLYTNANALSITVAYN